MKFKTASLSLLGALLLVQQPSPVQANAIVDFISVVSAVFSDVLGALTLENAPQEGYVLFQAEAGYDGATAAGVPPNPSTPRSNEYPSPLFVSTGADGSTIAACTNGAPGISSGASSQCSAPVQHNVRHHSLTLTAGDYAPTSYGTCAFQVCSSNEYKAVPTCLTYFKVQPDPEFTVSTPYVVLSAAVLTMDSSLPWYYSGYTVDGPSQANNCAVETMALPCLVMSAYDDATGTQFVETIRIADVNAYNSSMFNANFVAPSPSNVLITRSQNANQGSLGPNPPNEVLPNIHRRSTHVNDKTAMKAYIDDVHSAKALCDSKSSYGPSFLSTSEKMYCDMDSKVLYKPCGSTITSTCYTVSNNTVHLMSPRTGHQDGHNPVPASPIKSTPLINFKAIDRTPPKKRAAYSRKQNRFAKRGVCGTGGGSSGGGGGTTSPPTTNTCTAGYSGLQTGKGPKCACCTNQGDCLESCSNGYCTDNSGTTSGCMTGSTSIPPTTICNKKTLSGKSMTFNSKNTINTKATVKQSTGLKSPAGAQIFVESNGNVCIYDYKGVNTWCIGTRGSKNTPFKMYFEVDGVMCTYDGTGATQDCQGVFGATDSYRLTIQDDGHAYILDGQGCVRWNDNGNPKNVPSGSGSSGGSSGSGSCSGGNPGGKDGAGAAGACCKTSDDCKDTCTNGVCGAAP